jgi:hypothetical protein
MLVNKNLWSQWNDLVRNDVFILTETGVPTNGTSGDGAGFAGKGSLCIDSTNGKLYINTGTRLSPTWSLVGLQS